MSCAYPGQIIARAYTNAIVVNDAFAGYRWSYFSSLTDEALRSRAQIFIDSTVWKALTEYATTVRGGKECIILPDIGIGFNHIVVSLNSTS